MRFRARFGSAATAVGSGAAAREPAPLAISRLGTVEQLLTKAGLTVTGGAQVDCPFGFADHGEAFTPHTFAGPPRRVIDVAGVRCRRVAALWLSTAA